MVEMDYRDTAREHDWHTWYLQHVTGLIRNVPGFTATQRFRAITPTPSPWLALHQVDGPAIFESAAYKAHGGPASTGEWQALHTNWYRNVFDGIVKTPDVAVDQHLAMAEADAKLPADIAARMTWLTSVGLDRTAARRGILVLKPGEMTAEQFDIPGLRLFKPITPKISR